jgi:hypothetical protein
VRKLRDHADIVSPYSITYGTEKGQAGAGASPGGVPERSLCASTDARNLDRFFCDPVEMKRTNTLCSDPRPSASFACVSLNSIHFRRGLMLLFSLIVQEEKAEREKVEISLLAVEQGRSIRAFIVLG